MADYSVREWQRAQLRRDVEYDSEVLGPGQYSSPYPGVADIYTVLDFARAPESRRPSNFFTIDPAFSLQPGGGDFARAGAGQCFQLLVCGHAWIPSVANASVWGEYWLVADSLGCNFLNFERGLKAVAQFSIGETANFATSGVPRQRLVPHGGHTLQYPTPLSTMRFSLAAPPGLVTFPQMVYAASVVYDGTKAVLTVGAGHGVPVGDYLVALSGHLRDEYPCGAPVIGPLAADATLEVASTRQAGTEARVEVIVGSRWVRIPVHFRSLVSRTTNFTAP